MSDSWDRMIEALEQRKQAIDKVLGAVQTVREALEGLPPDIAQTVLDGLQSELQTLRPQANQSVPTAQGTYEKLVKHFQETENVPMTVPELATETGLSVNAIRTVLYGARREDFNSAKFGQGKMLIWNLRREIYDPQGAFRQQGSGETGSESGPTQAILDYIKKHPGCLQTKMVDDLEQKITTHSKDPKQILRSAAWTLVRSGILKKDNDQLWLGKSPD